MRVLNHQSQILTFVFVFLYISLASFLQPGNRTTADPRIFGPVTWRTVHRFAQHYPVSPTPDVQEACINFVNALPFMLPCPHCGYDLSQVISHREGDGGGCVSSAYDLD